MATKACVVEGTLSDTATGTVDLTGPTGFGTVDAAIIYMNFVYAANPRANAFVSVGFWDGTNNISFGVRSEDATSVTVTKRAANSDSLTAFGPDFDALEVTASAKTDGITLTTDTTVAGVSYKVQAILISGLTNAKALSYKLGSGTTYDINTIGFEPNCGFIGTVGYAGSADDQEVENLFSFGAFHNGTSTTQGCVILGDKNAESAQSISHSWFDQSHCVGQHYNDAASPSWRGSVGSFDSQGFTLTTDTNPVSDYIFILALEAPNDDDFHIGFDTLATSGTTDSYSSSPHEPDLVGLVVSQATANQTKADGFAFMLGAADTDDEVSISASSEDAQATSDTNSSRNTSNVVDFYDQTTTQNAVASLSSLNSDGFTLSYSDNASSAFKALVFTIGDSSAGGADDLTATDLDATTELDTPSLTQTHALTAVNLDATTELDTPALSTGHQLTATDVESAVDLDTPAIGQAHNLAAIDIDSSTEVDSPAIAQAHSLAATDVQSASQVSAPSLTENTADHNLLPDDVESTSEVDSPAIGQTHNFTAQEVFSTSEIVAPAITQTHVIAATDIESSTEISAPALDAPLVQPYGAIRSAARKSGDRPMRISRSRGVRKWPSRQ